MSLTVKNYGDAESTSSASASSTKAPTSATTAPEKTHSATPTPSESASSEGGTNVAGIVAGVVVGVVVVACAIGGGFLYMRRKRNKEIEEEHRRNAAVSAFVGKSPGSSAGSMTDARLDPVMAQRRMSDGSIADNQDYSRRILRVRWFLFFSRLRTSANRTRSPMHDRIPPSDDDKRTRPVFHFDISSIIGVLGKDGGKDITTQSRATTLGGGSINQLGETKPNLGCLFFFVCTVGVGAARRHIVWETCDQPGSCAMLALPLSFDYTF